MGNVQPTVRWGDSESDSQRQVSPRPLTGAPHSCAPPHPLPLPSPPGAPSAQQTRTYDDSRLKGVSQVPPDLLTLSGCRKGYTGP